MLSPSFGEPGQCFALKGSSGYVQIRLRGPIVPEAFTLEHVAKVLAHIQEYLCYVNDEIHQAESLNVKTQTWEPAPSLEMKEIWCRMIGLERSDEGINGAAESGQRMRLIPLLEKTNRFLEEAR
ncbi:hypothetical protein DY000_02009768 [Brassica cretica]|uniref:SUN domain-containing protein n=1 Tax=Brassica cretica TaxID=69181 RepID=A0ABQ7BZK9_BRACR|nr:hypothetical protein DY000_02009768 [Brassica cretica]